MPLSFNEEGLRACYKDIEALSQEHYLEVATNQNVRELDIDWNAYFAMENLHVFTMRSDGLLVGYISIFIHNHPRYKSWIHAVSDVYYVVPEHRGPDAVKFFQWMEREVRDKYGVMAIHIQDKIHQTRERFFTYLGYKPIEQVYEKVL